MSNVTFWIWSFQLLWIFRGIHIIRTFLNLCRTLWIYCMNLEIKCFFEYSLIKLTLCIDYGEGGAPMINPSICGVDCSYMYITISYLSAYGIHAHIFEIAIWPAARQLQYFNEKKNIANNWNRVQIPLLWMAMRVILSMFLFELRLDFTMKFYVRVLIVFSLNGKSSHPIHICTKYMRTNKTECKRSHKLFRVRVDLFN